MRSRNTAGARLKAPQGQLDLPFLLLVLLLMAVGLLMMFSASYAQSYRDHDSSTFYFKRQLLFATVGIAAMLLLSKIRYELWRKFALPILIGAGALMVLVIAFGLTAKGAQRWIELGSVQFQPSEIAKFAVVVWFAAIGAQSREKMQDIRYVGKMLAFPLAIVLALTMLERHLSATIIILAIGCILAFLAGAKKKWLAWVLLGALVLAALAIAAEELLYAKSGGDASQMPYFMRRIVAWLHTWDMQNQSDVSYQVVQSLYAVGSGGFLGLGFGLGRQKYLYLPEEHNDYVFAIGCEELGLVGAAVILLLFMLLILRGYWIALHAKNRFSSLLVSGLTTLLALQVVLNIAVVTNLIPATGISLPFFSYGGTALMMQLGEMGIILNVSRECGNSVLGTEAEQ